MQLGFVAGTIPVEKLAAFERLLFRATRGNMFLKFTAVGCVPDCVWPSCSGLGKRCRLRSASWRRLPTAGSCCWLLCRSALWLAQPPRPACLDPAPAQVGAVADPATGERVEKAVFVVFFAGERARQKILKICEVGAGLAAGLVAGLVED